MDKILSENLFLLEFLVDKVNLTPGAVPREISDVAGETCVSFKFLDNDPLDICEADFTPQRDYNRDTGNMKNGKSCLFAISPQQVNDATQKFDVEVAIFKKLTNGCLPDKLQIGHAVVPIAFMFNEILQLLQQKAEAGTVSRTLKETFPISGQSCGNIGDIGVFIRMSCFGKLIVTQFQMNLEEKSVFFKDKEGRSLYKYRKASRQEASGNQSSREQGYGGCCQSGGQSSGYEHSGGYGNSGGGVSGNAQSNCCTKPTAGCGLPCYGPSSIYTQHGGMVNKQTITSLPELTCPCNKWNDAPPVKPQQYPSTDYSSTYDTSTCKECNEPPPPVLTPAYPLCLSPPPCCPPVNCPPPKGCYQEIGAEMNGNALTIRVHKNKGLSVRKVDDDGSDIPSEACGCAAPPRPAKNGGCGCIGEGTPYMADPCRCLARPPPCADKQILSLKPGDDGNNPFTFKMSGCGNQARENITVVPPTSTRPDGMQVTEISDPNKDVFILRIGKKSEGTDKKANLELELVTPKGPDKKPIPKKETRDTQYLESDVPKTTVAKKPKPKKGKKKK